MIEALQGHCSRLCMGHHQFQCRMRCRGAFPLQQASLTLLPRHGGGYSACLARGADPGTLSLPSDPARGHDITAELLAAARRGRGVPVSLDGEGTHPRGAKVFRCKFGESACILACECSWQRFALQFTYTAAVLPT